MQNCVYTSWNAELIAKVQETVFRMNVETKKKLG